MRFLKRVEIHTIFPLFEGALETGKISRSSFRNWVVSLACEYQFVSLFCIIVICQISLFNLAMWSLVFIKLTTSKLLIIN